MGTWNSLKTFNQIPQEETIHRAWMWLDLYGICYLYDFYSVRIMFSRCKDVLQNIVISLKFCDYMLLLCETGRFPTNLHADNQTCINLILINVPRSFQSTCALETGLFDFHLMTLTVIRKRFKKFQPRVIRYWSYKH